MRTIRTSLPLALLALLLLLGGRPHHGAPSSLARASKTPDAADNHVAPYPGKKKKGVGRLLDWGLAKLENVVDWQGSVSELITAFIAKCDHAVAIMIHSFRELTMSYDTLHEKEVGRLDEFDADFKELVKLRNKIDRRCLYATSPEDRSLCIDKGIDVHGKIEDLRGRRAKSTAAIERYQGMIEWCASYNNWFC